MKNRSLRKQYPLLTPEERVELIFKAVKRNDRAEVGRLIGAKVEMDSPCGDCPIISAELSKCSIEQLREISNWKRNRGKGGDLI